MWNALFCAEDGCCAAEAFGDDAVLQMAESLGWTVGDNIEEAWCPRHRKCAHAGVVLNLIDDNYVATGQRFCTRCNRVI